MQYQYDTSPQYSTLHYLSIHFVTLRCIMQQHVTLHYTSLHYTTLHYTTLHYTTTLAHALLLLVGLAARMQCNAMEKTKTMAHSATLSHKTQQATITCSGVEMLEVSSNYIEGLCVTTDIANSRKTAHSHAAVEQGVGRARCGYA